MYLDLGYNQISNLSELTGLTNLGYMELDHNLEAAIRDAINKPMGDIYDTDLVGTGFTYLMAAVLATGLLGASYLSRRAFSSGVSWRAQRKP